MKTRHRGHSGAFNKSTDVFWWASKGFVSVVQWFCSHCSCVLLQYFKVNLFRNSSCLIPVIRKLPCLAMKEPFW